MRGRGRRTSSCTSSNKGGPRAMERRVVVGYGAKSHSCWGGALGGIRGGGSVGKSTPQRVEFEAVAHWGTRPGRAENPAPAQAGFRDSGDPAIVSGACATRQTAKGLQTSGYKCPRSATDLGRWILSTRGSRAGVRVADHRRP